MAFAVTATFSDSATTLTESFPNQHQAEMFAKELSRDGAFREIDSTTTIYFPPNRLNQITIVES